MSFRVPHRSAARNEKRMEALRECVRMITANAGGCTTPFPFEAAIWLLEEQEELYGGAIPIYNSVSAPGRCALAGGCFVPSLHETAYALRTYHMCRTNWVQTRACQANGWQASSSHVSVVVCICAGPIGSQRGSIHSLVPQFGTALHVYVTQLHLGHLGRHGHPGHRTLLFLICGFSRMSWQ